MASQARPQKPIRTARLLLRQIRPEQDAQAVFEMFQDKSTTQFGRRGPLPMEDIIAYLAARSTQGPEIYNFAVTLPDPADPGAEPAFIGIMGCSKVPEIAYKMHPGYLRRGYASEALGALLTRLWELMPSPAAAAAAAAAASEPGDHDRDGAEFPHSDFVIAHVDPENVASLGLLARLGFARGGMTKGAYTSQYLGLRDLFVLHIARPGMDLEDVLNGRCGVSPQESRATGCLTQYSLCDAEMKRVNRDRSSGNLDEGV